MTLYRPYGSGLQCSSTTSPTYLENDATSSVAGEGQTPTGRRNQKMTQWIKVNVRYWKPDLHYAITVPLERKLSVSAAYFHRCYLRIAGVGRAAYRSRCGSHPEGVDPVSGRGLVRFSTRRMALLQE